MTYRQVVNATRQAYLGVMSGIGSVKAQRQAVISNQSALNGNKEGYKIGTSTMVDVLLAQKALYKTQRDYAEARYSYVMAIIALKQSAGTLSADDLVRINSWLYSPSSHPRAVHKKTGKRTSAHNKSKIKSKKMTVKKTSVKKKPLTKSSTAKVKKKKSTTRYI